eukprot:NODE_378_length_2333_cov_30.612960_g352_i0.p1 GENE.NODE_378_length_2333_cov_30.612960_g352_i0~~NODE_378_length_2333_cov_30.612960_g352_i0.p1  ORF type:complete len:429 (+),score=60.74 NODE_378_length_2333_cov_30.612960_g352_i0:915-2201(+)
MGAFWGLWTPLSLPDEDGMVLRSFWLQRVLWEAGMRLVVVPDARQVDQAKMPACGPRSNCTSDFALQVAQAVLCWKPSRQDATLLEKAAELVRHLVDRKLLPEGELSRFNRFVGTVTRYGYGNPSFPPPPPGALGGLMTMMRRLDERTLQTYVLTWKRLEWLKPYPLLIFLDGHDEKMEQYVRGEMPGQQIHFYTPQGNFHPGISYGLTHQQGFLAGGKYHFWKHYGGLQWANQFLGIEMYKHPAFANLTYIMRLDDDIYVTSPSTLDVFADMAHRGALVGWTQGFHSLLNSGAIGLEPATDDYVCSDRRTFPLSDVWNTSSMWFVSAGCVEVYHRDVFQNQHYIEFLRGMSIWKMISNFWSEQDWKSVWQMVYVPGHRWHFYGCDLRTVHKNPRFTSLQPWFRKCEASNPAYPFANQPRNPHRRCRH